MLRAPATFVLAALLLPGLPAARAAGGPLRLQWNEGDVAGTSTIYGPEGDQPIGWIEYHQLRRDDVLTTVRMARFRDGSSDEDTAEARVAGNLETISGRSIVRDPDGETAVDLAIDVKGGKITGTVGRGAERQTIDKQVELPPATYFGPLVFIALKNFDANAEDGRVVFRTVAPTPRPMVFDLEIVREAEEPVTRTGSTLQSVRYALRPSVHWAVDPLIRLVAPHATFWIIPGDPPALVRYAGPRNYARQAIRIQ